MRAYFAAYAIAKQLRDYHDIPERVFSASLFIFKKLLKLKATQGRNRDSLVKACIMVACDHLNYPFIINWPVLSIKRFIVRKLKLPYSSVESHMFVSKLGYELRLPEQSISKAIRLVKGCHGLGPACAALNKQGVSIRRLSRLSGLSKNYIWRLSKESF